MTKREPARRRLAFAIAAGVLSAPISLWPRHARAQAGTSRNARAREPAVAPAKQESRPTVLLVEGPAPDWIRRVRGQLSDLSATISTTSAALQGLPEGELRARLEELAAARHAALVAWISIPSRASRKTEGVDATTVSIWFAESGRSYTRLVANHWSRSSASDRSGALELAALSVRSAVRSLLLDPASGGESFVGSSADRGQSSTPGSAETGAGTAANAASKTAASTVPAGSGSGAVTTPSTNTTPSESSATATAADAPGATAAASTTDPAARPDGASAPSAAVPSVTSKAPVEEPQIRISLPTVLDRSLAPDSSTASESSGGLSLDLRWRTELGLVGRLYGEPALGAAAFEAGVHATSGDWGLGVLAQLTLPTVSDVGPAQLELRRYALLGEGEYAAWNTGPWSLRPLLRAGLALITRQTVSHDATIVAERSDTHESPVFGLGLAAEYRVFERLGLVARGVLQWEPIGSKYSVVDRNGAPISSAQPWALQPSLEISGIWYW